MIRNLIIGKNISNNPELEQTNNVQETSPSRQILEILHTQALDISYSELWLVLLLVEY